VVVQELQALGYEVTRGLGGTGVVASLAGSDPQRGIVLRADLDALPIVEANDFAHASCSTASCTPAAMTATPSCCWVRRVLKQPTLAGSVHFVFQPGRGWGGGAQDDR
jgi:hippurate hydrolase